MVRVILCRFYEKGCCDRGDSDCWFSHDKTAKITPETYSCSICEHIFGTRSEFMHHRKKNTVRLFPNVEIYMELASLELQIVGFNMMNNKQSMQMITLQI